MTITTNNNGFDKAKMISSNHARLVAELRGGDTFYVDANDPNDGWSYNEKACREAAEFFLKLADELNRRSYDEAPF